ncbi:THO complex subunit 1-like [Amphiura filiformis]|uniref:THO complex subunit 1-like n=1 Tax=Amphiura filiformis TaxID=82378 RepID=UPI003B210643
MATITAEHDFLSARDRFMNAFSEARIDNDIDIVKTCAADVAGSDSERKLAVDQAFRDYIKDLVTNNGSYPDYISVINLSISSVTEGLCSPTTPFLLLSDVFDAVTIKDSNEVFKFVEEKVGTWKSNEFYTAGKNYLLRMCNDLLRRLSKSQDTVFCGRIQLFLARFFPLDEKSGLNLMSQFHLDNVTIFNTDAKEGSLRIEPKDESMDMEEGETSVRTPVDYTLYRKFWAIQDVFRNPTHCYFKDKWRNFSRNTRAVLEAFTSLKLDDIAASKKHASTQTREDKHTFFAKFLTSEKLFDLQLSDPTFRRYILVQFLILFQYLTQTVKFKQPHFQLTDDMTIFIKDTTEKVYNLLKETPPNAEEFCKTIQHCLSREEHWNAWKNEGCPSYVRENPSVDPSPQKAAGARKRSLGEDMESDDPSRKKIDMGNHELTRLWNISGDNMEACKSQERVFQPSMEEFFEEAMEEANPAAQIEDQYKLVHNSNYAWRALRLMARRSPYFFQTMTNTGPPIKTIPAYLELMITKLAKEIPQPAAAAEELKTEEENVDNDELLKGGEEVLEKVAILETEQLDPIVPKLGDNWKTLATELGFTDEEIAGIEDEQSEIKEQGRAMLIKWKDREGDQATKETLSKALQESGLKDIVESVLEATDENDGL